MILGFFIVRSVPPPEEKLNRQVYSETSSSAYEQRTSNSLSSHTPLLNHNPHPFCVIRNKSKHSFTIID